METQHVRRSPLIQTLACNGVPWWVIVDSTPSARCLEQHPACLSQLGQRGSIDGHEVSDVDRREKAWGLLSRRRARRGRRGPLPWSTTYQPSLSLLHWLVGSPRVLSTHYQPYQARPPVAHRFRAGSQSLPGRETPRPRVLTRVRQRVPGHRD